MAICVIFNGYYIGTGRSSAAPDFYWIYVRDMYAVENVYYLQNTTAHMKDAEQAYYVAKLEMDKEEHEVRMRILLLQEEFEIQRLKKLETWLHVNSTFNV